MAKKKSRTKKHSGLHMLIVESRFYEGISDELLNGATRVLDNAGARYDRVTVPGTLEIPTAIGIAMDASRRRRAWMRGPRRNPPFRDRGERVSTRIDGSLGAGAPSGRQRHHHSRKRGAGARAGEGRGRRQGRTCSACRTRHGRAQADTGVALMGAPAARDEKDARKANKRGAARLAAVQALYQMDLAGTGLNDILAEFESHWIGREVEGAQYLPAEAAFFRDIVSGVVREQRELDPLIDNALSKGWPLKRIEAVLRASLRAGAYELIHRNDVPARVVVTEYADVAAAFVGRDETGMVNAVLDQLARRLRAGEFDRAAG